MGKSDDDKLTGEQLLEAIETTLESQSVTAEDVRLAKLRDRALQLRCSGLTFAQIGAEMRIDTSHACSVVNTALNEFAKVSREDCQTKQRAQIAELMQVWWPKAVGKNPNQKAFDNVMRLLEREARLEGADAPQKHHVSGAGGGPLTVRLVEQSEISALTDEQLAEAITTAQSAVARAIASAASGGSTPGTAVGSGATTPGETVGSRKD